MAAGNQRKTGILFASQKTRVSGVTGDQTVKATPALLHRLVISNNDVAAQTVTIKDGAATLIVIKVPPNSPFQPELFIQMVTSVILNPSNANLDILAVYD
jgi:hypothetical protein